MKKLIIIFTLVSFVFACKSNEVDPTEASAKILTANNWRLDRFANPNGRTLSNSELDSKAQAIFGLEIEFRKDNVTRGLDKESKEIKNAGTWYLKDENKKLDIQIVGFGGEFKVLELSNKVLRIQAENNAFISATSTVNVELIPAL